MRRVEFEPAQLVGEERDWWERWSARAAAATQAVLDDVAAGSRPGWTPAVWSELKQWLLANVFDGKCAYCEKKITGGFFGDAEHYRPKGKVTVKEHGRVDTVMHDGKPHPGYYWLAYNWRNLLPACELCNSSDGKMNQFPVANGHVFRPEDGPDPDALDLAEGPLLLHPYRDDPSRHLRFGVEGTVAPRDGSREGEESIKVYDLSRELLETERSTAQKHAEDGFLLALVRRTPLDEAMESYTGRQAEFSQAVYDYLVDKRDELVAMLNAAFRSPDRRSSPAGVSPPTQ